MGKLTTKPIGFTGFDHYTSSTDTHGIVACIEQGYDEMRIGITHTKNSIPGIQAYVSATESNNFSDGDLRSMPVFGGSVNNNIDQAGNGWKTVTFGADGSVGLMQGTGTTELAEFLVSDWISVDSLTRTDGVLTNNPLALIRVMPFPISITSITAGGANYSVNDEITFSQGSGDTGALGQGTTFRAIVTSVNAGAVDGLKVSYPGFNYAIDSLTQVSVTPGTGAGCTINVQPEDYTFGAGENDTLMRTDTTENLGRQVSSYLRVNQEEMTPPKTAGNQTLVTQENPMNIFIQFRSATTVGVTVMTNGDSLTTGSGQITDKLSNWGLQGCALASDGGTIAQHVNGGFGARTQAAFQAAGQALALIIEPEVMDFAVASVNDFNGNETPSECQAKFDTALTRVQDHLTFCSVNGIKPILMTIMPSELDFPTLANDDIRKQYNTDIKTLGATVFDADVVITDGLSPASIAAPFITVDLRHINDAGHAALGPHYATAIERVVSESSTLTAAGSIRVNTLVNGVAPIGGLSGSIIGVSTNPVGTAFSADQAADHISQKIGGLNSGGVEGVDFEAVVGASINNENKHIRFETATAPVVPNGAFPNTYLNKTSPAKTVDTGESAFSVEP